MESAIENGNISLIKIFLQDVSITELNNCLIEAAKYGHLEIVEYTIEQGADIHENFDLALQYASLENNLEVVKYLVMHGLICMPRVIVLCHGQHAEVI